MYRSLAGTLEHLADKGFNDVLIHIYYLTKLNGCRCFKKLVLKFSNLSFGKIVLCQ
jgi:hypothetical protein